MLNLAAITDSTFAEAAERDYQLSHQEVALLDNDTVLVLAVQEVHATCEQLASLSGAPALEVHKLPGSRRGAIDDLVTATKERVVWLENIARYRVKSLTRLIKQVPILAK